MQTYLQSKTLVATEEEFLHRCKAVDETIELSKVDAQDLGYNLTRLTNSVDTLVDKCKSIVEREQERQSRRREVSRQLENDYDAWLKISEEEYQLRAMRIRSLLANETQDQSFDELQSRLEQLEEKKKLKERIKHLEQELR